MKEMKESLLGGQNIVTFTMYLDPRHYDIIRHFDLLKDANYVHCMAYDARGQHSTIEFATKGIELAKTEGFDHQKWTLGLPFYGRDIYTGEAKAFYEISPDGDKDTIGNIFYNSQRTLAYKTRMAVQQGNVRGHVALAGHSRT